MTSFVTRSTGYMDELVLAPLWIHRATGEVWYRDRAVSLYWGASIHWPAWALDWDNQQAAAQVNTTALNKGHNRDIPAPLNCRLTLPQKPYR